MSARVLLTLAATACATALVVQGLRWRAATRAEATAVARLHRIAIDAQQLAALSGQSERVALSERPPQDLIARIRAALTDSGLSAAALDGVQPESSAPVRTAPRSMTGAADYQRQAARAVFRGVTLADLGKFLDRWSRTQSLWTPATITLTHDGSDDPRGVYRVELTLAATYLDDGAAP
ncbi:MAG: hypothetical protein ACF8R7_00695 [Phycisphaerales bacterium JB039]